MEKLDALEPLIKWSADFTLCISLLRQW